MNDFSSDFFVSKNKIISLFLKNVKGRKFEVLAVNVDHDGKEGHWLETQMGISHNGRNEPDIFGFEMKNDTRSKTSFGDWSADYYIFKDEKYDISRDDFIKIFGKPNEKKNGRFSWSGEPIPKINLYSNFGEILLIDEFENILIEYNYNMDRRPNKSSIVPKNMRKKNLLLARWNKESIKSKLEKKFNNYGWFKCIKNTDGFYTNIVFGDKISWEKWIDGVKKGLIFFDSGMYVGNIRPYSQWRANNKYWEENINSKY